MKLMFGCVVWNKVDMIAWLLDGISLAAPPNSHIVFCFDACQDGSARAFEAMTEFWISNRGHTFDFIETETEVREVGGHNELLKAFFKHDPSELLVVIQDDQHLNGPLVGLEEAWKEHGERLGVVTGRDGYRKGYADFVGSPWTASAVHRKLAIGEFAPRPFLNSGPVIYHKRLVETVGMLDQNYHAFYVWDDYGARATKLGFVNGALGTDLTHAKFGRIIDTTFYTSEISKRDNTRLNSLHPGVVF